MPDVNLLIQFFVYTFLDGRGEGMDPGHKVKVFHKHTVLQFPAIIKCKCKNGRGL